MFVSNHQEILDAAQAVDWWDVLNCVDTAAVDRCEPERYREMFRNAAQDVRHFLHVAGIEVRDE